MSKTLRNIRLALAAAALLLGGYAWAQAPGAIQTSPVVVPGSFDFNGGPQASIVRASGGTFTCTSGGAIVVPNTAITANSVIWFSLKTKAGSATAPPYMTAITVGTSFTATCATNETSVFNYIVLG